MDRRGRTAREPRPPARSPPPTRSAAAARRPSSAAAPPGRAAPPPQTALSFAAPARPTQGNTPGRRASMAAAPASRRPARRRGASTRTSARNPLGRGEAGALSPYRAKCRKGQDDRGYLLRQMSFALGRRPVRGALRLHLYTIRRAPSVKRQERRGAGKGAPEAVILLWAAARPPIFQPALRSRWPPLCSSALT